MRYRKVTALALAGAMAATLMLGGCGSKIDSEAIAATCGGEELTLGYMAFTAHYYQAIYDSTYYGYVGDTSYWTDPNYGDGYGSTLEDSVKDMVLEEIELDCLMDQHMADYGLEITDDQMAGMQEAAETFMSDNDSKVLSSMDASVEDVAQFIYYTTVADLMTDAIRGEAGEDLDIGDYARRTFSYIRFDETGYTDDDGNYVEYTDEERDDLRDQVSDFAEVVADDFDGAADDYGYTLAKHSYGEDEIDDEDSEFGEAVIKAADGMSVGDVSGVIDNGDYLYIIRLDSEDDQDAAETAMSQDSSQLKSDHYNEVIDSYFEESDFSYDESLWDQVRFTNIYVVTDES